jgi:hypothetical protein
MSPSLFLPGLLPGMNRRSRVLARRLFAAALFSLATLCSAQISIRSVKVLGGKQTVEIEVEASDRITPQTQVLTGPDRLVVDFPNAVPSNQLRSQSVDRGEVKDVRVGLFQAKPPVTRVVVDLSSAQSYQIFPGRTVMIKVTGSAASRDETAAGGYFSAGAPGRVGLVTANYRAGAEPVTVGASTVGAPAIGTPAIGAPAISAAQQPALQVTFRNGLLGVRANKATLSEVLYAIQQKTGADISIAAGAEQERVVAEIDPAPAPEVLARLLNGSKFNFLILSAANDPQQLDKVILSTRPEMNFVPSPGGVQRNIAPPPSDEPADEEPAYLRNVPNQGPTPPQDPTKPEVDNNNPPPDQNAPPKNTPDQ